MADSTTTTTTNTANDPPAQLQGTLAFGHRRHSSGHQVTAHRELLPPSMEATARPERHQAPPRPALTAEQREQRREQRRLRAWRGQQRRAQQARMRSQQQQQEEESWDNSLVRQTLLDEGEVWMELTFEGKMALLEFLEEVRK